MKGIRDRERFLRLAVSHQRSSISIQQLPTAKASARIPAMSSSNQEQTQLAQNGGDYTVATQQTGDGVNNGEQPVSH